MMDENQDDLKFEDKDDLPKNEHFLNTNVI